MADVNQLLVMLQEAVTKLTKRDTIIGTAMYKLIKV